MASPNLSCPGCRIRIRASAQDIGLLAGDCPICGARLREASSASSVMGFRLFDLDGWSEQHASSPPPSPDQPVNRGAHRASASAPYEVNAEWAWDEGSSVNGRALAARLPVP